MRKTYQKGELARDKKSGETLVILKCKEPTPHNPVYVLLVLRPDHKQSWVIDTDIEPVQEHLSHK